MKEIKYDKKSLKPYEHLDPIVDFLLQNGNRIARAYRWGENRSGYFCLLAFPIDFNLLEKEFNFPAYIRFDRKEDAIFCDKTWCYVKGCVSES